MAGVLKERNPPQQPLSSVQPFDFLSFENTDVTSGTDGFGPGCVTRSPLKLCLELTLGPSHARSSAGWDAIWLVRGIARCTEGVRMS